MLTVAAFTMLGTGLGACSSSGGTTPQPTYTTGPAGLPHPSSAAAAPASGSYVAAAGAACGLVILTEVTTAVGQPMVISGDAGSICTFSDTASGSMVLPVTTYADAHKYEQIDPELGQGAPSGSDRRSPRPRTRRPDGRGKIPGVPAHHALMIDKLPLVLPFTVATRRIPCGQPQERPATGRPTRRA